MVNFRHESITLRQLRPLRGILIFSAVVTVFIVYYCTHDYTDYTSFNFRHSFQPSDHNCEISIAIIICGTRIMIKQAKVLLKSSLVWQGSCDLEFLIVGEREPQAILDGMELLPNHTKVLYVDLDVIFINEIAQVWNQFNIMNSSHILGAGVNRIAGRKGVRTATHFGLGINAGVLLMDLEKIRKSKWLSQLNSIFISQKKNVNDQVGLNRYFYKNPNQLLLLDPGYCYTPPIVDVDLKTCYEPRYSSVTILHAWNRMSVLKSKWNVYTEVFNAYDEYILGDDLNSTLLQPLTSKIDKFKSYDSCPKLKYTFYFHLQRMVDKEENT